MKSNAETAVLTTHTRTGDFVALAKPRLNMLVVGSALAGYAMAGGDPSHVFRMLATVVGTALVASGASAYNQILERKTDALMQRTRLRPAPGRAPARRARRSSSPRPCQRSASRRWPRGSTRVILRDRGAGHARRYVVICTPLQHP